MVKVDLKDACFMRQGFLKFVTNATGLTACLRCAPWVFTKVLKPVAAQLREMGVILIVYIDNT